MMNFFDFTDVDITAGFLHEKQEMNRKITINAVYDRFVETGRIGAFSCSWKEGEPNKPHFFYDSDGAKWMEGAAYILQKHPDAELEAKVEALIDQIEQHQGADGYFNIYFTVCEPDKRFSNRHCHELYCAGHLFEAAVAYAEATGRTRFLHCMEKYAEYIYRVFVQEKSAAFTTPGHEEIELALIRMYRYTGNKRYRELAAFFLEQRGRIEAEKSAYMQSHRPIREQTEAVGHAVRATYLYTAMADLALETGDTELAETCEALFRDITRRKMYVTGGIGSNYIGEDFTKPYDLPNEDAYSETCAGIGLMFFCRRMQRLHNCAAYADTIERVFYNNVLAGIATDGQSFFYENPLEITLLDHFSDELGARRLPITQRVACFSCSCCPPNLNRLLPTLENYIYGWEDEVLYVNQFAASTLHHGDLRCEMKTAYPVDGEIELCVSGAAEVAVRIPGWCGEYTINHPYELRDGYAYIRNDGTPIRVCLDMRPFPLYADSRVVKDVNRVCIQAGPIVYCAESRDNGENLHALSVADDFRYTVHYSPEIGLNTLTVSGYRTENAGEALYTRKQPLRRPVDITLIPYCAFANRGESDMLVWLNRCPAEAANTDRC